VFKRIVAMVAVLAMLTGCTGGKDFWGNPVPTPEPASCAVPTLAPPPPYDPSSDQRPPGVTPGFSWLSFEIRVEAVSAGGDINFCVPVSVYAYALSGEPDTITLNRAGLPAEANTFPAITPMHDKYMSLQYDPTEERFAGRPPSYEVHVTANYVRERDHINTLENNPYMMLICTIRIGGAPVVREYIFISSEDPGGAVSCTLKGNSGWRHF